MSPKHIPARRSRTTMRSAERPDQGPSGRKHYRPKRVRAGSATSKAKRKQAAAAASDGASPKAVPGGHMAGTLAGQAASPAAAAPELTERQRRHLRGLAHELKPVIRLGNAGLTDAVAAETARALHDHELIKVKAPGGDRDARNALFDELAQRTSSALIHRIGNVAVLYRPNATLPRILIPDATA
jgi:RNA-binding protein